MVERVGAAAPVLASLNYGGTLIATIVRVIGDSIAASRSGCDALVFAQIKTCAARHA